MTIVLDSRSILTDVFAEAIGDPDLFNDAILGRESYWPRQRDVCRSVVETPVTLVPTGNAVGKTYLAAGLLHWYLLSHPGCLVIATAPTQRQLEEVLWKEVERAYRNSRIPLGGRLLQSPLKVDLGHGWQALAYSTNRVERFSGHHAPDVLAIGDEASGILDEIAEAIASLNPSRELWTGNPLRPDGFFYERCVNALERPNGLARVIQISSLESPHIDRRRSPWGLADATWLEKCRNDYGEGSIWWTTHVLGQFPDAGFDTVLPRAWIERAISVQPERRGPCRIAVDLAEGRGGDRSVVLCRDDDGIIEWKASPVWSFEQTAAEVKRVALAYGVEPHRITWDSAGIGADFSNRLQAQGLVGCRPYRGGSGTYRKFGNLRASAAWALRQRLDPGRKIEVTPGVHILQRPFALRADFVRAAREELQGLRYHLTGAEKVELEDKEEWMKRLHRSPDLVDALMQTFAFPE